MASAQELLHEQTDLPAAQPGEGPKKRGRIKFPKLKRKLPVKRLIARLGLEQYDVAAPLEDKLLTTGSVRIMLRMGVGAPSVPVV